ncbi:MAG: lipoprotein insertase outer membrane protein LolB [Gammaproteobacteria bacterium]|nr:MAG: lipoprotein insertase outer membrane protein LolB [Gammaproteobacteria bacterium]
MKPAACLAAAVLLVSAGCAPLIPEPSKVRPEARWQARHSQLARIDSWIVQARVAVSTDKDGWQATLVWRQKKSTFDILLQGPIGQGSLTLAGEPGHVTLQTSKRESWVAADPDALLADRLGWRIPVSGLRYWILGIPDPGLAADKVLDDAGRLKRLQQSGWTISYLDYVYSGLFELPRRMVLVHPELKIRIVIAAWELTT